MDTKSCRVCGKTFPLTGFYRQHGKVWSSKCRTCYSAAQQERAREKYRTDPAYRERCRARGRDYFWGNRNAVLARMSNQPAARTPRDPVKEKARHVIADAIERGKLIRPKNCQLCWGGGKIHAHHEDHALPWDVVWLCTKCHGLTERGKYHLPEKIA